LDEVGFEEKRQDVGTKVRNNTVGTEFEQKFVIKLKKFQSFEDEV
jgi:hypothetical protein